MGADIELKVDSLEKRYSPDVVIGPITFEVERGEFISVLGPSGCGKTTLLRCIAGFETPTGGEILLGGQAVNSRPPNKRDVGLVFQSYALFPHLTVYDNVAFGLKIRRTPKDELRRKVERALDLVGLLEMKARYPSEISGGQQQRVAIARAVILEPRLMLFDEPLSNLDLKLRMQMRNELRSLQRDLGLTAIYVTHDQTEALALSDRIIVLSNGKLEQVGPPVTIYERPASAFVADFIGTSNILDADVVSDAPLKVRTRGGLTLGATAGDGTSPPRECKVMIRPERIAVASGGSAMPDAFPANVAQITYLGETQIIELRTKGGEVLLVSATGKGERFEIDQEVMAAADSSDVQILVR